MTIKKITETRSVKFFADYASAQYLNNPRTPISYKIPQTQMEAGAQPTNNPLCRCIICHEALNVPADVSDHKVMELFQGFMVTLYDCAEIYQYEFETMERWAEKTLGKLPQPSIKQYLEKYATDKKCSLPQAVAKIANGIGSPLETVWGWSNDDSSASKATMTAIHGYVCRR